MAMQNLHNFLWSRRMLPLKNALYYPLRKHWDRLRVRMSINDTRPPVVVYQMGKVASKSIEYSIRAYTDLPVFHAHMLNPQNMEMRRAEFVRLFGKKYVSYYFSYGMNLFEKLFQAGHRVRIISLVREPIGRNISQYFQNLDYLWKMNAAHSHVPVNELVDRFHSDFDHNEPIKWFDDEFQAVTGIDVYSRPFPWERGYLRWNTDQFDVLVLRHDLDDDQKGEAVGNFLGVKDLRMQNENKSEAKSYRKTYQEFLKGIRLSDEYVSRMLDSRYAKHFYSETELEKISRRWETRR
jgi:hypothetical protein